MMLRSMLVACVVCTGVITLTGCATDVSPNNYAAGDVGVASKVVAGTIISKREIVINKSNGNIGTLAGGAAGAVGGSAIGGGDRANIVGGIGGALLGGVIGNAADKAINKSKGFEYMIRLTKDDSVISITQDKDLALAINQKVLVIYGAMTRIVPDETAK